MHCAGEHSQGSQEHDILLQHSSITAGVSTTALWKIKVNCMLAPLIQSGKPPNEPMQRRIPVQQHPPRALVDLAMSACLRQLLKIQACRVPHQTPNLAMQWQAIDLRSAGLSTAQHEEERGVAMTKAPFRIIPVKHNSHALWYTDVSSAFGLSWEEYSSAGAHSRI